MNKHAFFLFIPIFAIFFLWGLQIGDNLELKGSVNSTPQIYESNKIINPLPNGQKSIIIFIVSYLDVKSPDLIGVWLVSYISTEPYATVLGLYPTSSQNEALFDNRLVDLLKLDNMNGVSLLENDFIEALKRRNIWASGYLLIDVEGLNKALEVSLNGNNPESNLNSEDLIFHILNNEEQPNSRQISQLVLLQQLCNKFSKPDSDAELNSLKDLYPDHISGNIDPDILIEDWLQFIKSRNGSFCVFPQKEMLFQIIK